MKTSTSMSPATPSLLHVAHHESGHCCIAILQGLPLDSASIHPTKGERGDVQLAKKVSNLNLASLPPTKRQDIGTRILLVALGGAAALTVIEGNACWDAAEEDLLVYDDTLDKMGVPECERREMFFRLFARAIRLIRENQGGVESLATVLVQKTVLTGDETKRVMMQGDGQ